MGFRNGAYAKVWSVEDKGKTKNVRLSISHKVKGEENKYEQDFSGFCMFIGQSAQKAATLKMGDNIKLNNVEVTTWYNKETSVQRVTYKVWDFDIMQPKSNSSKSTQSVSSNNFEGDVSEDDLPFG